MRIHPRTHTIFPPEYFIFEQGSFRTKTNPPPGKPPLFGFPKMIHNKNDNSAKGNQWEKTTLVKPMLLDPTGREDSTGISKKIKETEFKNKNDDFAKGNIPN